VAGVNEEGACCRVGWQGRQEVGRDMISERRSDGEIWAR